MRYLIVNADDFGAGRGINRGILQAHRQGILTSASLMVDRPAADDAARAAGAVPDLSVGLHAVFTNEACEPLLDFDDAIACRDALQRQLDRFHRLLGRGPSHLDTHHNVQRDARLLPVLLQAAVEAEVPLREHSPVRYFSRFYGQWDGETHLEQISFENLVRMLADDVGPGVTELSCHPGHVDPDFLSSYAIERDVEARTLCDPRLPGVLGQLRIRLISYHDLAAGVLAI